MSSHGDDIKPTKIWLSLTLSIQVSDTDVWTTVGFTTLVKRSGGLFHGLREQPQVGSAPLQEPAPRRSQSLRKGHRQQNRVFIIGLPFILVPYRYMD